MDRLSELVDELLAWTEEIAIDSGFISLMRRISEKRVILLLVFIYGMCHHYGRCRDQLHDLDNAARPVSRI